MIPVVRKDRDLPRLFGGADDSLKAGAQYGQGGKHLDTWASNPRNRPKSGKTMGLPQQQTLREKGVRSGGFIGTRTLLE